MAPQPRLRNAPSLRRHIHTRQSTNRQSNRRTRRTTLHLRQLLQLTLRKTHASLRSTWADRSLLMKQIKLKKYQRGQMGAAVGGGILSLIGGERRNRAQRQMAREQMRFQERMSSTAFQRQAKDLQKAGLNRILGLSGSGASSPAGAMAAIQDVITPAVSTALAVKLQRQQIKNLQAVEQVEIAKRQIMAPATEAGQQIGSWLRTIRQADWSAMGRQLLQDLKLLGVPHSARQLQAPKKQSPLEITIPGYEDQLQKQRRKRGRSKK